MAYTKDGRPSVVVIAGPTATGKSELAVMLAERFHGEVVNADSMQVYRGMDIGTAKPDAELLRRVPHHLLDLLEPDQNFSAGDFQRHAAAAIAEITGRGKRVFLVGGTGLYLKALLQGLVSAPAVNTAHRQRLEALWDAQQAGEMHRELARLDPSAAARLHPNDRARIIRALAVSSGDRRISDLWQEHCFAGDDYRSLKIGLDLDRLELYRRIEQRVDSMLERGLVDEVRGLLAAGFGPGLKSMGAIGYRQICQYLMGECTLADAVALIKRDTRRYAKRQLTWFRADREIIWLVYPTNFASICNYVIDFYV